MASKIKYYDISKRIKDDIPYYVVFGKRRNGKTYSSLDYVLKQFFKTGKQFVYLRRYEKDITGARGDKVFSDFYDRQYIYKISKGRYEGLKYYNRALYACKFDENDKAIFNQTDLIGYFMCLSDVEHDKSTGGYPNVGTIVFDEFITRGGYLADEFVVFQNVISTIIRNKQDVKIIMLGNTINKFCPYFQEMGLTHIAKMKVGSVDLYEYGDSGLKVFVEYTGSDTGDSTNNFYFAFNNPKLKMITTGEWELPLYPHCNISFKESDVIFRYYIIFEEKCFECQIVSKDLSMFTFIFEKTTPIKDTQNALIYNREYAENRNYYRNIMKPFNELTKHIVWFYNQEKVFFSNNEVGNYIESYLQECKR